MKPLKTSRKGIDLIKSFEGLCRTAYRLPGETYYTIGYGHYGADVKPGQTVTTEQAEALLARDLVRFEGWVAQYTPFPMNQNQFDALVSFCYNCGPGNLRQLVEGRDANTYTDKKMLEMYQYMDGRLRGVEGQIQQQAVINAQITANISCMQGEIAALNGLTKTVIPIGNVCPEPMARYNSWSAPTTTATTTG